MIDTDRRSCQKHQKNEKSTAKYRHPISIQGQCHVHYVLYLTHSPTFSSHTTNRQQNKHCYSNQQQNIIITMSNFSLFTLLVLLVCVTFIQAFEFVNIYQAASDGANPKYQLTTAPISDGGWSNQGTVFKGVTNLPGSAPIYVYINSNSWLYIYSPRTDESIAGFVKGDIMFYAFDLPLPYALPVYEHILIIDTTFRRYTFEETVTGYNKGKIAFYAFKLDFQFSGSVDYHQLAVAPYFTAKVPEPYNENYLGLVTRVSRQSSAGTVPIYQYINKAKSEWRHMYSTQAAAVYDSRFVRETAPAFYAYNKTKAGAVPLFQHSDPDEMSMFKYSLKDSEEGFMYDHRAFYVLPATKTASPTFATVYKRLSSGRVLYTTDPTVSSTWTDGGIAFKVIANYNDIPNALPVSLGLKGSGSAQQFIYGFTQKGTMDSLYTRYETMFYAYYQQEIDTIPIYLQRNTGTSAMVLSTDANLDAHERIRVAFYVYPANYNNFFCYGIPSGTGTVCSGHGTCTSADKCDCNSGWMGTQCQVTHCFGYTSTHKDTCSGNGECVAVDKCACKAGWNGHNCQTKAASQ
jgi:hypothetical protein